VNRRRIVSAIALAFAASLALRAQQPATQPLVRENATEKISPHVYWIPDGDVPQVSNTYQPSPRQERRSSPSGPRVKKTRDGKK